MHDIRTIAPCQCGHDPHWLKLEIATGRYPQKFQIVNDEYVLICVHCGGLWDHRATERLIDLAHRDFFIPLLKSSHANDSRIRKVLVALPLPYLDVAEIGPQQFGRYIGVGIMEEEIDIFDGPLQQRVTHCATTNMRNRVIGLYHVEDRVVLFQHSLSFRRLIPEEEKRRPFGTARCH